MRNLNTYIILLIIITLNLTIVSANVTSNESAVNESYDFKTLDKNRPIYFAMDHVNSNDEAICNNIVNKLESNGFNVVSKEIGPSTIYDDVLYLYENNISDAIVFHVFNGVDPSTIRELAINGDDNRGRIVRSNGNDVVLAWFYDSIDCVNPGGSGYNHVLGSETGYSLENPREYMDINGIYSICTSSDGGRHKEGADYDGTKTADEFMKLFEETTTANKTPEEYIMSNKTSDLFNQ